MLEEEIFVMEKCIEIFKNMEKATPADWRYLRHKLGVVTSDLIIRAGSADPDKLYMDGDEIRYEGYPTELNVRVKGIDAWMRKHIHDIPPELLRELRRPDGENVYEYWRKV